MELRTTTTTTETATLIPEAHRAAALQYIKAIVRHDPLTILGEPFVTNRIDELMESFAARYTNLGTGGYARHGADALRIALGQL